MSTSSVARYDDSRRLAHMGDYARQAEAFLSGRAHADLDTDRMLQLAILNIISEAASRVTQDCRANYPAISWPETIAFRDRVTDYDFRIDNDLVWRIVRHDLPTLIANLERATPGHTA
jgi:uncharacterized protein with HEPN domain